MNVYIHQVLHCLHSMINIFYVVHMMQIVDEFQLSPKSVLFPGKGSKYPRLVYGAAFGE